MALQVISLACNTHRPLPRMLTLLAKQIRHSALFQANKLHRWTMLLFNPYICLRPTVVRRHGMSLFIAPDLRVKSNVILIYGT